MIYFFQKDQTVFAVGSETQFDKDSIEKLIWLFGKADLLKTADVKGSFVGPRKEMISPWSTNAVEITQNMAIQGIYRMEEFFITDSAKPVFDPMIRHHYTHLDQDIFTVHLAPQPVLEIENIAAYNRQEGLSLS